jgi:arginase family enzyme
LHARSSESPRAQLEERESEAQLSIERVPYDIAPVEDEIRRVGLPPDLAVQRRPGDRSAPEAERVADADHRVLEITRGHPAPPSANAVSR